MNQSAIKLTEQERAHFNNQVNQMNRRRKAWETVGAIIALLMTYGLVVYFLIETIIKALLR